MSAGFETRAFGKETCRSLRNAVHVVASCNRLIVGYVLLVGVVASSSAGEEEKAASSRQRLVVNVSSGIQSFAAVQGGAGETAVGKHAQERKNDQVVVVAGVAIVDNKIYIDGDLVPDEVNTFRSRKTGMPYRIDRRGGAVAVKMAE